MSYCVHCGVELDASAVKCALCDTPVLDPNIPKKEAAEKPFSDTLLIPKSIRTKFVAYVITMIMLIPNIVLFLVNMFFVRSSFWSLYFLATTLLVWVMFVFPFFTKKRKPYLMAAFDTLSVCVYAFVIFALRGKDPLVFLCFVFVVALLSVSSFIMIAWQRKAKRHWTATLVHIFTDIFVISLASGLVNSYILKNSDLFFVGLIVAACCVSLLCFFLYCNRSRRVRAWLNKAFYF